MTTLQTSKPPLLAILAWIVLWAIYFAPVLPRSKVLAPLDILESLERPWARTESVDVWNAFCYDAVSQYIPYDYAVFKSLRDDGFIGWNPDMHNGSCLQENHMLCPSSLRHVFYRFLPFWDAWDWGRMVHFLLAGLGMILLLSEVGLPSWAALFGAVVFSFSSQMVVWIHSDVIASGCCWSPWMLWSLFRLRRLSNVSSIERPLIRYQAGIALSALLSGVFLGFALRCGFLHTTLFNLSLLLLFFVSEIRRPQQTAGGHSSRWPFLVAIAIGFAIATPWLLDVVPPAFNGGHVLRPRSFFDGIKAMPTLVTSFFPTLIATPQGIDGFKVFGGDFYDIKFAGGTALVLALFALFRRDAPRLPKFLFVLFLAIPFTPLAKWYYHRCFVISAIGIAWLAAWRLNWQVRNEPSVRTWRCILSFFAFVCALWLLASFVLARLEPGLLPKLQSRIVQTLPASKAGRVGWMVDRAARFYRESLIWSPRTFAGVIGLGLGLFAASRVRLGNRHNGMAVFVVVLATFTELALFGTRIFRPCDRPRPTGDSPYSDREWIARFQSHLGNGSVVFWQPPAKGGHADFDYMQINAPSAHGIRQAEGYESVQPLRLSPLDQGAFAPADYALSGISHVSTPHGQSFPHAEIWRKVESSSDFDLYENPAFQSIFIDRLVDGTEIPLQATSTTPNSVRLSLPAGTQSLRIAMTHHSGWHYRLGHEIMQLLPQSSDGYLASEIVFPNPLEEQADLELCFMN